MKKRQRTQLRGEKGQENLSNSAKELDKVVAEAKIGINKC